MVGAEGQRDRHLAGLIGRPEAGDGDDCDCLGGVGVVRIDAKDRAGGDTLPLGHAEGCVAGDDRSRQQSVVAGDGGEDLPSDLARADVAA